MAARREEGYLRKKGIHKFSCVQRSIDRRRRGVEGHRISGDTTGSWLRNRRFRSRKAGGATVVRLTCQPTTPGRRTLHGQTRGCPTTRSRGEALHHLADLPDC